MLPGDLYSEIVCSSARIPPDLLEFPSEFLLPPDNDRDVVLLVDHLDVSSGYFLLDVVATLHRYQLVVLTMEDYNLASYSVPDHVEVGVDLGGSPADDVVERMPRSVVGVAEEAFH